MKNGKIIMHDLVKIQKPTPGPWKAECFLVTAANGREVTNTGILEARSSFHNNQSGKDEDEANARLIAKAPEMLEIINTLAMQGHRDTCQQLLLNNKKCTCGYQKAYEILRSI